MNLTRLRVLREVARLGTFAAAADALSFTPSAVSQQMARLEAEVGATLMERTPRGVRLTEAGHALLARATAILELVRDAESDLQAISGLSARRLRLGSFPSATQALTPRALAAFRAGHPDVHVVLTDDEPERNLERLRERALDLAIVHAPRGAEPPDGVETELLFVDPFVLVVPEGHRFARRARVPLAALDNETVVGDQHALPDHQSVRALVAAGEGVALLPRMAAALPYPGTATTALHDGAPAREILVARPAGGLLSTPASAMRELLLQLAAEVEAGVPAAA
jgi:DNA-binding transcriptional LysR family regulator